MPNKRSTGVKTGTRDLRLDVFRGLCLVMIYINHIPGNLFENYTSRNFGFSDSAEGFVFMSGVAAGLAYVTPFRHGFSWQGIGRVWRRAWTLYLVHAMTTLAALGILSYGALYLGAGSIMTRNNFGEFLTQPLAVHAAMPLLFYQLGYVNILPMYMVMLLLAPFMLWAALRRPYLIWGVSAAIWLGAGLWHWNLPNRPLGGGWFFNPISWQFIFCTGLLTGVALKDGKRFLPVSLSMQILTGCLLLLAAFATQITAVSLAVGHSLWMLQELGLPYIFTTFDKTFETAPRLFHIFALAYFLSTFASVRRIVSHRSMAPLALLGRNSLPIFAAGSLLALTSQVTKAALPPTFALDALLVFGGLGAQLLFAYALEKGRLSR